MNDVYLKDQDLWKQKARAFVTRCHRHLWGKNNEDPLVFLFRQGLSNEFIKKMYLGWNKYGQERGLAKWGLEKEQGKKPEKDTFILPPGIVIPYIVEKELMAVWILPLSSPGSSFILPGSARGPITLGNPTNPIKEVDGLLEGLGLFQENKERFFLKIWP
jgi:hypothetical protein